MGQRAPSVLLLEGARALSKARAGEKRKQGRGWWTVEALGTSTRLGRPTAMDGKVGWRLKKAGRGEGEPVLGVCGWWQGAVAQSRRRECDQEERAARIPGVVAVRRGRLVLDGSAARKPWAYCCCARGRLATKGRRLCPPSAAGSVVSHGAPSFGGDEAAVQCSRARPRQNLARAGDGGSSGCWVSAGYLLPGGRLDSRGRGPGAPAPGACSKAVADPRARRMLPLLPCARTEKMWRATSACPSWKATSASACSRRAATGSKAPTWRAGSRCECPAPPAAQRQEVEGEEEAEQEQVRRDGEGRGDESRVAGLGRRP
jgi:hypothetical protein